MSRLLPVHLDDVIKQRLLALALLGVPIDARDIRKIKEGEADFERVVREVVIMVVVEEGVLYLSGGELGEEELLLDFLELHLDLA